MDSLVSLFAMEASGVIDAETMVKGVVLIALCFSYMIFLRGSLASQAWASSSGHHHFITEPSNSIALSHV